MLYMCMKKYIPTYIICYRVSRSQMVQRLWHTRVDKQQMDAYMDVAVIRKDIEETAPRVTRSSRKRRREEDTNNCSSKSSQGINCTQYMYSVIDIACSTYTSRCTSLMCACVSQMHDSTF